MDKENLADIPTEHPLQDDKVEDVQENEDSEDSQSEKNTEEETQSDEGEESNDDDNTQSEKDIPFNEHPRFKELIDEKNSLKEQVEDLTAFKEETANRFDSLGNKEASLPEWWITLYGDSQESKKAFSQYSDADKKVRDEIKKEILEEQRKSEEKAKKEQKEQDEWVNKELASLKDSGAKFDKNKFLKFALENPIVDANNNIDFKKIYKFYEIDNAETKDTKKLTAKKKLASDTISSKSGQDGADTKKYKTSKDLRNKSFATLLDEE